MKKIIVHSYSGLAKALYQAKRNGYQVTQEISGKRYILEKPGAESIQIEKRKPEE